MVESVKQPNTSEDSYSTNGIAFIYLPVLLRDWEILKIFLVTSCVGYMKLHVRQEPVMLI